MEEQIQSVTGVVDAIIDFGVTYGFQLLGAIVFLVIGLKLAGWAGGQTAKFAEARNLDQTLARFFGNVVRVVLIVFVAVITLGNFGIAIAPLIALAGASAFGATLALQGPLSNYAAGFVIVRTRPFVVGNRLGARSVAMPHATVGHRKLCVTRPVSSASRPVGRVSRSLGASKPLDDAQRSPGASPAGFLLPSYRDTRSYGYHMLDSIH